MYLPPDTGPPVAPTASYAAAADDELPPPPPPAELYVDSSAEYSAELPAPPSPVSSSYSELRRANQGAPPPTYPASSTAAQFATYAPASQTVRSCLGSVMVAKVNVNHKVSENGAHLDLC